MAQIKVLEAPPLPADIDDWVRHIKSERTLNDLVEDIHRTLVGESVEYRELLRAVSNARAVEGSMAVDDVLAAMMIRQKAKDTHSTEVAAEPLADIIDALGVVLRRYKASRKQRRNTLRGEEVPPDNNGS